VKDYTSAQIRNVALVGHSGAGKTTLVEAILAHTGVIGLPGSVEKGNTVSDYDSEEQTRQISVSTSLIPVEYEDVKINMLDCPGFRDFVGEIKNAVRVAEMALVIVDAVTGVEVGTEFACDFSDEYHIPKAFFINKMDKERASFEKAMASIEESFEGVHTIPVELPIGEGESFCGVVDLINMRAVIHEDGKSKVVDIPAEMQERAAEARRALVEAAAEGNDDLTEKFLLEEDLTPEEVVLGLRQDMQAGRFCPVLCGSAAQGIGMRALLHFFHSECPPPTERRGFLAYTSSAKDASDLKKIDPAGPFSAYVFKTVNDEYVGRLSFFKVVTGSTEGDGAIRNVRSSQNLRAGHVFTERGRQQIQVPKLVAGDIGAFAKLEGVLTGDTITDPKCPPIEYEPTRLPAPAVHMAIRAKHKGEEDKLGMSLHKFREADPTLLLVRDSLLQQTVISGQGDTHLDIIASRLKNQAKVEVVLEPPKIQYRETISKEAEAQGKYKKQTGGRGQYGDCWVRFKPLPRGSGFEFEWKIVGGVIPTNFNSSVEKGLREALNKGSMAGYPMVDVRAECFFGSYHAVDSSDMAFQVAASLAFKNAMPKCGMQLLEPINKVSVVVPDEYMGDVMGYVSGRRGRIAGSDQEGSKVRVMAEVPAAEMATFSQDLRSMTQGRAIFEAIFDHYEPVPNAIVDKVIADVRIDHGESE